MRFKAAFLFSTIFVVHGIMLQWCHGERINITEVDRATKEEVSFLEKNAVPFEQIQRNPGFLDTLPYLHYLCSAMLRPPTNRKTVSASPPPHRRQLSRAVASPGKRHLFSNIAASPATRHLFSNIALRQISSPGAQLGVAYIREWARKEMFGRLPHVRMNIIQSVMNVMCNKIYSTPEGQYLLKTHKIRYNPDSLYDNKTQHLNITTDEEDDDMFTDLETKLKNLKGDAEGHFRGGGLKKGKGNNQTSQKENVRQPGVTLESVKPRKLNRTIINILPHKISKVAAKYDEDKKRSELEKVQETPSILVYKGELGNKTYPDKKTSTVSKESTKADDKVQLENKTLRGDNSDTLKQSVSEGKLQKFSIQPETSNMEKNPQIIHRGSGFTISPGKYITETNENIGKPRAKFESEGIERQNVTIANISFQEISKFDKDVVLNKFDKGALSLGKSVSEEKIENVTTREELIKHDRKPHSEGISDTFNGKIRQKVRNISNHRNIFKTRKNTEISVKPSPVLNQTGYGTKSTYKPPYTITPQAEDDDDDDNEQLTEVEDELVKNLEIKLKELKPDADLPRSTKHKARNGTVNANTTLSQEAVESRALETTNESISDVNVTRDLRTDRQSAESIDPQQDQATLFPEDKIGNISKRDDRSNPKHEAIHRENLSSEEKPPNDSSFETKPRTDLEVTPNHGRKYESRNKSEAAVETQIDSDDFDSQWATPEANETE